MQRYPNDLSVKLWINAAPASVSLAWLLAKGMTAPIASARVLEQLDALAAAPNVKLSEEHIAQLDKALEAYL